MRSGRREKCATGSSDGISVGNTRPDFEIATEGCIHSRYCENPCAPPEEGLRRERTLEKQVGACATEEQVMKDPFKVFVSSTYADLQDYRDAASAVISALGLVKRSIDNRQ